MKHEHYLFFTVSMFILWLICVAVALLRDMPVAWAGAGLAVLGFSIAQWSPEHFKESDPEDQDIPAESELNETMN